MCDFLAVVLTKKIFSFYHIQKTPPFTEGAFYYLPIRAADYFTSSKIIITENQLFIILWYKFDC